MKHLLAFCLLSLLAINSLPAQDTQDHVGRLTPTENNTSNVPIGIARQIGGFFTNIQNNNIKFAYQNLFKGTQQASDDELITNLINMTTNTIDKFGVVETYELIDVRKFGTHLLDVSYVTLHKEKFYRWQFIYQSVNGNDWLLTNMAVDDLRALLPPYPITTAPPDYVQADLEKFFVAIQNHDVNGAFAELTKNSPLGSSNEQISAFISKTSLALNKYGALLNHELFDNRPIGTKLRFLTYVTILEREPLRWQFIYTVDKDGKWTLSTIRVDDQIAAGIINSN